MKNLKLIFFGAFTGLCNGLFGSGGGMIAVPCLERYADLEPQKSHATAIAVILPLTVVSLVAYTKGVKLDMASFWYIVSGGVAGSIVGATMLKKISSGLLKKIFGLFILVAAFRMVTK